MEIMGLEQKIEAVLFWKGEPMKISKLAEILKVSKSEVEEAVAGLKNTLAGRGVVLLENNSEITLGTAPDLSTLFENLQKEELNKDLSKASLETLSIVLYKNGASRSEIDYIRGVNSSFTLRALSVRGLVEKTLDPRDARRFIYKPSFETLSYLGIKSINELPEYSEVSSGMEVAAKNLADEEKEENGSAN